MNYFIEFYIQILNKTNHLALKFCLAFALGMTPLDTRQATTGAILESWFRAAAGGYPLTAHVTAGDSGVIHGKFNKSNTQVSQI